MNTQLFGPSNAGGSFADKVAQARDFLNGARGQAPAAAVDLDPITHGLAAEAPVEAAAAAAADVAPSAAASTGMDAAAPVITAAGHDADGLAAAARAAAQQSIADPAYVAAAQQNVEFIVQPRVLVQGQSGPVVVPVDIAVPAATTNVTVAPAQAVVLDPATGQIVAAPQAAAPVAAPAAAAQAADVATPPTRGLRSWGIEDLANLGRGRNTAAVVAPAAEAAVSAAADAAPAASGGGWRAQINDAIVAARGPASPAAGVADVIADAPKVGLLERIRANTAGIGEVLTRTAPDLAPVADDAAKAVRPGVGAALRAAVEAAKIAR